MWYDKALLKALELLPKNTVSRAMGAVSDVPLPAPIRGAVNRGFALYAGIDLDESEQPPSAYTSLNAFFTRRLREGARELAPCSPSTLVSPCDGRLVTWGRMESDTLVQAKGREYTLRDLVDSGAEAERLSGGHYATIYLSPRDYHRVHSPTAGQVREVGYIPGHLFPVNPFAVNNVDQLFAVNERLITYMDNPALGRVAVVMVGATCVGRMGLAFHGTRTNGRFRRREEITLDAPVELAHGDELGVFNLGSTVILIIAEPDFDFEPHLTPGQPVRMGELLGHGSAEP